MKSYYNLSNTDIIIKDKFTKNFIKKSTQSIPGYDSCMQPFMFKNKERKSTVGLNISTVMKKLHKIPLPINIRILFTAIGRTDIETYYNDWTLLSLDKIEKMYNQYVKDGQKRSVNFAMKYAGMGHVCMVSYDPETGKIYYKMENGANGYDSEYNYKKARDYVPIEKDLHDILHWVDLIEKKDFDVFSIPMIG